MVKPNGKWIMKTLTDVYSSQPNGTLHSYDYFEDKSDKWIYNISFHINGCFASVQLEEAKRIPIDKAIKKARTIFQNTKYVQQSYYNS